jgi:EAL domain-containing protein (putative c-di-GMP-specific phosphodiesterase class I)
MELAGCGDTWLLIWEPRAVKTCQHCGTEPQDTFDFTMAFQPIVRLSSRSVWGYEALVRGPAGEGARTVLEKLTDDNRYWFDQSCRVKAIEMASGLFPPDCYLSINFMPSAVYEPRACIRQTLRATTQTGFAPSRLMFEFTENETIVDPDHLKGIVATYKQLGFLTGIDDFGAGYSGLALLSRFQPDIIKIDMELLRDIDSTPAKQAILRGILQIAADLDVTILAEGIETEAEFRFLQGTGIDLFQGYYFARPQTGSLPALDGRFTNAV